MIKPSSVQKLAENEVYFRGRNEQVQNDLDELTKVAIEQGDNPPDYDSAQPFHFYCECSDENCMKRIEISLDDYNAIHQDKSSFIIVPDHDTKKIEKVTDKKAHYWVVEKFMDPPEDVTALHPTTVNNT